MPIQHVLFEINLTADPDDFMGVVQIGGSKAAHDMLCCESKGGETASATIEVWE